MNATKYLTIENVSEKKAARIFKFISISIVTGCWNWTGAITKDGYGVTNWGTQSVPAHRFMYAWFFGPIPAGQKKSGSLELDHAACNNRACVNPYHLVLISTRDNVLRGCGITAVNAVKTHCVKGHLLPTEANTPKGHRRCMECTRIRALRYSRAHKKERAAYCKANRDKLNARRREWRRKRRLLGLPKS